MSEVLAETRGKQTLLKKYDIPVSHLDFGFIKSCTKAKEVEKIVKVLRSQEEGYYPELLECAEKKLGELDPFNRLLRVEGKLLTKDNLEPQYWKSLFDDIEKWSDEYTQKEKELISLKNKNSSCETTEDTYPPIRRPPKTMEKKEKAEKNKMNDKISSYDYQKWDKYDADAECLKMDLEEEMRQQDPLPVKKFDSESELEALCKEASSSSASLSKTEKEILALKEKDIGNEFYKNRDFKLAIRSYSKSIAIYPTSFAFNNRAASYLNLDCYDKAVSDATAVIQMEPSNIKALYRRSQAYEKLSEFSEALSDLNAILKLEPTNALAKSMKDKIKSKKSAKPKSSAGSSAKRSKLTLESRSEVKSGPSGMSSSGGGDKIIEPIAGPSGVKSNTTTTTENVSAKRLSSESKSNARNEGAKVKRDMRKIDVLEVDREDDDSIFDWRRYFTEGRSAKIEVASKFREKSSKEPRPDTKSIFEALKKPEPSTPSTSDSGLIKSPLTSPRTCSKQSNRPLKYDSSCFTQSWELLSREGANLASKAQLLRSVRPHLLQSVIGNKLGEEMLSDFVLCLRDEFKIKAERSLIIEYLTSFARLERFAIIKNFLPTPTKQVIQDLLNNINADMSLRKLYL